MSRPANRGGDAERKQGRPMLAIGRPCCYNPAMGERAEQPQTTDRPGLWPRIKVGVNVAFLVLLLGSIVPVVWLNTPAGRRADGHAVRLRFMYWGGPEQLLQENDVHAAFKDYLRQRGREDIEVELLWGSARYWSKLQAMLSAGEAPDVFMVAPGSIAKFADRESPLILDITELVVEEIARDHALPAGARKELDFPDLLPEAIKTFYCNGRLYGFPRDYKCTGVGYNAAMLAEMGLEDPNDLYARDEWTWDRFLEYLEKLNRVRTDASGASRHVFGLFQDSFNEGYWHNILLQAGGGIWSDDGRELIIDKPESIAGLQFVHDLAWKYRVAKPWTPELGATHPWVSGETAMLGFRGWFVPSFVNWTYQIKTDDFRFPWDVAPWPLGPIQAYDPEAVADGQGRTTGWRLRSDRVVLPGAMVWLDKPGKGPFRLKQCTATGIGYCIYAGSPHKAEAWTLLTFLVSPEAQRIRAAYELKTRDGMITIPGPNMPSRQSVKPYYLKLAEDSPVRPASFTGSLEHKNRQKRWPTVDVFIDAREYGRAATGSLIQDEIGRELDRQFQRMLMSPDVTPQEVARVTREKAAVIIRRIEQSPFPSSYNTPSLVRPADQDPLGLAP